MFGISKEIWADYSFKEKLYVISERAHVLKIAQFINRKILRNEPADSKVSKTPKAPSNTWNALENKYIDFFNIIEQMASIPCESNILISGYISTFRKGGNLFFDLLNKQIPKARILTLSQSGEDITKRLKSLIDFEYLIMPIVPFKDGYQRNLDIALPEDVKAVISDKEYLQDAIFNIKSYHNDMGEGYAEAIVYFMYISTRVMIEKLDLKLLIVHNKLYPLHDVMLNAAKELGVKTLFFEFGAIPGTFALEDQGQMGGSYVATDYKKFRELLVTDGELEDAEKVINYLKESGLNRNEQPKSDVIEELKEKLKPKRPVILYAGQNDYDSGICPYKEYSKELHSPVFHNSDEAAVYLAELAQKNNWNLIYKPHPLPIKHGFCLKKGLPENIIWVSDVDINEIIDLADVVVTILSQVGDVAVLRSKATVMLGYTQLRGKGCCYEAYEKEVIEETLQRAIKHGMTDDQQECFVRHVAQELKYYLYDDCTQKPFQIGQTIAQCGEYVKKYLDKGFTDTTNECKVIEEKYIFVESELFHNKLISNEIDLLDELAAIVGKNNIMVKRYSDESKLRFEMRSYKTIYLEQKEWFDLIRDIKMKNHYILQLKNQESFEPYTKVGQIYLYKLYIGKKPLKMNFIKTFEKTYIPTSMEEYRAILSDIERIEVKKDEK